MQKLSSKKEWQIDAAAFQTLLRWLDANADSQARTYLSIHNRLVGYFDRKDCSAPNELADEVLNRVARRLEEERGKIETEAPAKYCYIVARFVFMEHMRDRGKERSFQAEASKSLPPHSGRATNDEDEIKEVMLQCLDRCTQKLLLRDREIILRYYIGKERVKIDNRRLLADELKITMNALAIRACRIRDKLESCVNECVERN